ncbi:MAG: RHS domain-containing protein [Burkholderiales bacterium]|nr:RHS domain-containing protein [Burkholderiales bacterium]
MRASNSSSPEGFFAELAQTLEALWNSVTANTDRLAFVHVNHLGAPVAATDEAGRILWQVDYVPYGGLIRTSASPGNQTAYTLALRLPGQWEDAESGLYYNDFRYYDPQAGRYLSPDPLGRLAERLGSPNAYAYVNNNPLSYIDPWGLILFAFDGTNNSNPPPDRDDFSNVYKFYLAYDDGKRWYMNGIGRPDPDSGIGTGLLYFASGDVGIAFTARDRVNYMLERFDDYMGGFNLEVQRGCMIA